MRDIPDPIVVYESDVGGWHSDADWMPPVPVTGELRRRLQDDLEALVRIEYEFLMAQQVLSEIDFAALALATQRAQMAEVWQLLYGDSPELEAYAGANYQQSSHEMIAWAHAQVLNYVKRG